MHLQFRAGTTLEDAHKTAHEMQDAIRDRLGDADVLIHLEPEDRVMPGTEIPVDPPIGNSSPAVGQPHGHASGRHTQDH
jgi:hypothetical protein